MNYCNLMFAYCLLLALYSNVSAIASGLYAEQSANYDQGLIGMRLIDLSLEIYLYIGITSLCL